MSRPQRIEYENAFYHVMNRGAGRRDIYHSEQDYYMFLELLSDANRRFGIEIHCYCLMSNHYHLLIKTPNANLGRAMRHINGVYTQRYNRAHQTDGPLFRGRYKAILVESDSYLLHLTKYIHLNPVKAEIVQDLNHYEWSSYPDFVGNRNSSSKWLNKREVYSQLNTTKASEVSYKLFMQSREINQELANFYNKERLAPVLGSEQFLNIIPYTTPHEEVCLAERVGGELELEKIISLVSDTFSISKDRLLSSRKGKGVRNRPRKIAMYLCLHQAGFWLKDIVKAFNLAHYGGVSSAVGAVKKDIAEDLNF